MSHQMKGWSKHNYGSGKRWPYLVDHAQRALEHRIEDLWNLACDEALHEHTMVSERQH